MGDKEAQDQTVNEPYDNVRIVLELDRKSSSGTLLPAKIWISSASSILASSTEMLVNEAPQNYYTG